MPPRSGELAVSADSGTDRDGRSAHRETVAAVDQAVVAVRGVAVSGADVVGDQRADPPASVAHRTGPAEACRLVGEDGLDVAAPSRSRPGS